MLLDAEHDGNQSVVSWLPDGRSFRILNKVEFVETISKFVVQNVPISPNQFDYDEIPANA